MYISFHRSYLVVVACLNILCISQTSMTVESIITLRITENIAIGSVIGRLFDLIVPRPNKHTLYKLNSNRYFLIKDYEKIVVIGVIDRDYDKDICTERNLNNSCIWKNILLSSNSAHRVLRIIIEDENDNSPRWLLPVTNVEVTENLSPSQCNIELPKALDPDEHPNNTAVYIIDPPSKYVFIHNETTVNGLTPYLRLHQSLDREVLGSHNVTVIAYDGGSPPKSGSMLLAIKIIDENDNSPLFESSIYTFTMDKYLNVNERIDLKIKATDPDEGGNGNLTYRLSLGNNFVISNCFSLDPLSAVIIVRRPLTGQCFLPEYRLSVTATDQGNPIRSGTTSVLLVANSRNTFPPNILMPNKEPTISVPENNNIGFLLTTVAVQDKDSGINGQFQCTIRGNNTEKVSIISNKSSVGDLTIIQLIAVGVFDREIEAEIFLTIVCVDFGEPSLSSSKDLTVTVLDANDNRPVFKEEAYYIKILEENEPYQRLGQLLAVDFDDGYNGKVTYQIESYTSDDVTSRLTIDFNGNIIAKERLDREKFPNGFNFTVTASDQGRPPLKGSTEVYLELLDVNDNSPTFRRDYYNFTFPEDVSSHHHSRLLGQVTAWDPDLLNNSVITYSISQAHPMPFKLNPESGQLYSYSLIDRDSQPGHYVFTVLALDNPNNLLYRRTGSVTVSVTISDRNDNRPTFVFPNDENDRVQLSFQSPVGTVVTTIKATDRDSGVNAKIVYSLVDPDRNILFSINQTSGQLTISTVLNSIHEGIEKLFIRASDCGSPSLSAIQRLVVEIGDYKPPLAGNSDSTNNHTDPFLSDQATYIIVGIVLGTFFICCGLVTGICTMTYRQWRSSRIRASSSRQYAEEVDDPAQLQMYIDNYLEMKEMI